jgi:hypothetical protein
MSALFPSLNKRLLRIAPIKHLWLYILGTAEDLPIWLIRTNMIYDKRKPHILICAGFHGEEKAGPLTIIRWLESKSIPTNIDISFIPVVNPVGFNIGQRYNNKNQKTNCGFCHPELGDAPSEEGQILLANEVILRRLSRDGFLDLHEDVTANEYYIYDYENGTQPSPLALAIRDVEDRFFPRYGDGNGVVTNGSSVVLYGQTEPVTVKEGIVFNLCDGSYEDFRMHQGCRHALATETPAKGVQLNKRINANTAIIDKFIEMTVKEFYEN